jgi:alpha-L-fucosidase
MNPSRRQFLGYFGSSLALTCAAPKSLALMRGLDQSCSTLAVPTSLQHKWQDMEMGTFIHFAPNVYYDMQGDKGGVSDPKIFNPYKLDADQWVRVAKSMGSRYLILTAKHVGGFCLWPTSTTDYSIASTPYKNGKGDIVGEVAEACRYHDIRFGVYVSPRDDHHNAGLSGKVHSGNAQEQEKYDAIYRQQLTELLTRYGSMVEVWFDGSARGDLIGPIVHKYQPQAMIFNTAAGTIRWVGNEDGVAPYPLWNTVTHQDHQTGNASGAGDPDGDVWLPAECDVPIRSDWFWSTTNAPTLKSLNQLMDIYYRSVGRGANLLLNQTPDRTGVIPDPDVQRTAEFGQEIQRRFSTPLAATSGAGNTVELRLTASSSIDHIVIAEDISDGQRVREYTIEIHDGNRWVKLTSGTSIGHKRIEILHPAQVTGVRLNITRSVCSPQIASLSVLSTKS